MATKKATKAKEVKQDFEIDDDIEVKDIVEEAIKPKARPKRVVVDRSTELVFMNNTSGNLFYKCPRTHVIFDLYEYGDTDYITVDQLLTMNNTHRKMLKELLVILLDVVTEDVEMDDVLRYLGIEELYTDVIKPNDIDGFIKKSTDAKFKDALSKMNKALATRVIERSAVLYKNEQFTSIAKISILKEFTENEDLFE